MRQEFELRGLEIFGWVLELRDIGVHSSFSVHEGLRVYGLEFELPFKGISSGCRA